LRLEAQKISHRQPDFQLRASSFQPIAYVHLQYPHNTGSRREAQFFNTLLMSAAVLATPAKGQEKRNM
jgi:hypothetical protein